MSGKTGGPMALRPRRCQPHRWPNMAGHDKEREERLAAALRENLRKRKAQARDVRERPEGDDRETDAG